MKFMFLVLQDIRLSGRMTEGDWKAFSDECLAYDRRWLKRGKYRVSWALEGPETATTVRVRSGEAIVTDGPFMETKEQVSGVLLLDAEDGEEAEAIAAECPFTRIGAVEMRATVDIERIER